MSAPYNGLGLILGCKKRKNVITIGFWLEGVLFWCVNWSGANVKYIVVGIKEGHIPFLNCWKIITLSEDSYFEITQRSIKPFERKPYNPCDFYQLISQV